jgi:predicted Zn finger-like uncharacterized protein
MIVTCSNCAKRYVVDPRALGTSGRRVRCANCQHTWFQSAPEETRAPIEPLPPPQAPPTVDTSDAAPRIQLPALPRRRRGLVWVRRGLVAAAIVLAIWGLASERQEVMGALPATTRLYSMVGLGPSVPGVGLELRQVTPSRGIDNGVPTLAINGQVANISSTARAVPKLRVALRDAGNNEVQSWTVPVSDQPLAPGATVPFHTSVSQPADDATGVIVSFAPAGS